MKWAITVLVFVLLLGFCAMLFWLAGFNFDKRSPDVAFYTLMSVVFSAFFSMAFFGYLDECSEK